MKIDQEFINSLPDNPWLATQEIIKKFFELEKYISSHKIPVKQSYNQYIEILSFFLLYTEEFKIPHTILKSTGNTSSDIKKMKEIFINTNALINKKLNENLLKQSMEKHSLMLSKGFFYEFSDNDLKEIQLLINELRDLINNSKILTTDHKNRLLKRLEKLQSELHKRTNNLDRFYGAFIDFGYTLGRFGDKAKPFFDRLEQISKIVKNVIEAAEGLPQGSLPKLPLPKTDEE